MTFRNLLAATLLAGGVLAAGAAARADTVKFTAGDYNTSGQVDVTGSFSYNSGLTTVTSADLTAFEISFKNLTNGPEPDVAFCLTSVGGCVANMAGFSWVFSYEPSTHSLDGSFGYVFEALSTSASPQAGFKIYRYPSSAHYFAYVYDGADGDTEETGLTNLTFTPAGSSAVPEPPAAAVLGLALFGLVLVRGRGGRLRGA